MKKKFIALLITLSCALLAVPGVAFADSTPDATGTFTTPTPGQSYSDYWTANKNANNAIDIPSTATIGTFTAAEVKTIYRYDAEAGTLSAMSTGDTFYDGTYFAYFELTLQGAAFSGSDSSIDGLTCIYTLNGTAITPFVSSLADKTPTVANFQAMETEVLNSIAAGGAITDYYGETDGNSMIRTRINGYYKFDITGAPKPTPTPEPTPTPDPDPVEPDPEPVIPETGDVTPVCAGVAGAILAGAICIVARKRTA